MGSDRVITLRARRLWDIVPGEIESRIDVDALGLVPLKLEDRGPWTPQEHYWGESDEPIEEWARPIIARGARQSFEMEQVVPGQDPADFDSDPICESNDLKDTGHPAAARQILMGLCQADLRCLDAHAHLGNPVLFQGNINGFSWPVSVSGKARSAGNGSPFPRDATPPGTLTG